MTGIDVSKYNGYIDYDKVKKAGVKFVIIRVGYGQNIKSQDDRFFETNYAKAKKAGLDIGVYIYSYAKNKDMAKSEADHCLRLLKGKTINLPVYYDVEDVQIKNVNWNITCKTFCEAIKKAGYIPGIYLSKSMLGKIAEVKNNYTLWVASWGSNNGRIPSNKESYDMWQYTSKGQVNGIEGWVDMNILNKSFTGTGTTSKPVTPRKSVKTLALETLKGVYGEGDQRKRALGTKYAEVQKKINLWYVMAEDVKKGKYGTGAKRKKALGEDYNGVQYIINHSK